MEDVNDTEYQKRTPDNQLPIKKNQQQPPTATLDNQQASLDNRHSKANNKQLPLTDTPDN
jgi:hypothetical protein